MQHNLAKNLTSKANNLGIIRGIVLMYFWHEHKSQINLLTLTYIIQMQNFLLLSSSFPCLLCRCEQRFNKGQTCTTVYHGHAGSGFPAGWQLPVLTPYYRSDSGGNFWQEQQLSSLLLSSSLSDWYDPWCTDKLLYFVLTYL